MIYVRLLTTNPYYNLAVEEYLFRNAKDDVFMLWQNEPSVIVGKNQNAYAEANLEYAEEKGIHICRRITGGGAVYHDLGNVNYTFISTRGDAKALDFEYFSRPVRAALSKLGVKSKMSERNDIECEEGKFSGNAQHAEGGRILHHGTLLFNTDLDAMESVLRVDREKLEYRAVKSCRSRVVNLSELILEAVSLEGFISQVESSVVSELSATFSEPPCGAEIEKLYKRNMSPDWIFSGGRYLTGYTVERKRKYSFGLVEIKLELEDGLIQRARIAGDFFSMKPIEELEGLLVGMNPYSLPCFDPSPYICGMSFSDLAELLA